MADSDLFEQVARKQAVRISRLVGKNESTRLQWLLKFAQTLDFERIANSKFERTKKQIKAFAATTSSSFEIQSKAISRRAMAGMAAAVKDGLLAYAKGNSWDLPPMQLSASLIPDLDTVVYDGSWNDVFLISAANLIPIARGLLRVCARPGCSVLFVRRKRKIFCSVRCADRERMLRFQADPIRYKAKRRQYYLKSSRRSQPDGKA